MSVAALGVAGFRGKRKLTMEPGEAMVGYDNDYKPCVSSQGHSHHPSAGPALLPVDSLLFSQCQSLLDFVVPHLPDCAIGLNYY